VAGCNNRQSIIVPNRVLDRPTEVALACVTRDPDSGVITTNSLEACQTSSSGSTTGSCGDTRLLGFIANSEKDDVAMFSTCANAVIDMDVATPGAQLIPAGKVPTSMVVTTGSPDACFAVSGNLGSCDLSVFDVAGFAAYAWDEAPEDDPSALVQTIVPTRGDGTPLGSRPGQMVAVPLELSNSVLFGDNVGGGSTSGGDDEGGASETGETDGGGTVLRCDPERPGSLYVTFPSCQLVAELDLRTHRILQSRQFVRSDDGTVDVIDSGVDPECPIDCPEQFIDFPEALAAAPLGEADGMYPAALALVSPTAPEDVIDPEDAQVLDHSLYVGGLGSDSLFELRYDGTRWTDDALSLELQDASGISLIRPTPAMELTIDLSGPIYHQFLYIVAGDGSTRVVRREFDLNRTEPGLECDTQVDPAAAPLTRVCHPADFPGENPPNRRPFARGPGIRAPNGALITDWTFQKLIRCDSDQSGMGLKATPSFPRYCLDAGAAVNEDAPNASSPFGQVGVIGVGTTSFGRLVFVTFGQFGNPVVSALNDPLGLLDATILPHMLWPTLDPTISDADPLGLPRMNDAEPVRTLPGKSEDADAIKVLAPALRRIDMAYADLPSIPCKNVKDCLLDLCGDEELVEPAVYEQCQKDLCNERPCTCDPDDAMCVPSLVCNEYNQCEVTQIYEISPPVTDADRFGNPEAGESGERGLYKKEVVRAVVRDYAAWSDVEWTLQWEGEIPGTTSVQGQLVCEQPGWFGGTCISSEPGDTRLVDTSADFCDSGVLAGDRLALFACDSDDDCGEGQFCLVDPRTPGNVSGICVSQEAYADTDRLLEICEDLVFDPCGPPRREFLITRAFKDEVWLQALDKPVTSYVMYDRPKTEEELDALAEMTEEERELLAEQDRLNLCAGRTIHDVVRDTPEQIDGLTSGPIECQARLTCALEQPESGCESHADCVAQSHEEDEAGDPKGYPGDARDIYPLCIDGLCRRVCNVKLPDPERPEDPEALLPADDEDCILRRLPGPACLRELIQYTVTARNSFVLRGQGSYQFLKQRVKADPETGECYEDPLVSNLLTSRIRLGSDEADTRNNTAWPIPSCPAGSGKPDGGAPNPCFIDVLRPSGSGDNVPEWLFHQFEFGDLDDKGRVPALRFSNPMMSIVLDLTSIQGLTAPIPGRDEESWPSIFREFQRSRIPRNFTESFTTLGGYKPFNVGVVTSNIALIGPTRIINAPESSTVFIVDTSGGGGTSGVRGQLVRVNLAGGQVTPDTTFQVH
jgi:hypothetical protein